MARTATNIKIFIFLLVAAIDNGFSLPVAVAQSFGASGTRGGQSVQTQNTFPNFGYGNFPSFKFNGRPGFPGPAPPRFFPPPPPPVFTHKPITFTPPPPVFRGGGIQQEQQQPQVGKPYCEMLKYLESEDSCHTPNTKHPFKGSCTKYKRCFPFRSGQIRPLILSCAVGEIFSTISYECEDEQVQTTFGRDNCPQIYCDSPDGKPKEKSTTSQTSFVVPIIPTTNVPSREQSWSCPPQDEDLEFGPVQKCGPTPNEATRFGYRSSGPPPQKDQSQDNSQFLRPVFEAPTTRQPVDEYVGQKHVHHHNQYGAKPPPDEGPYYEKSPKPPPTRPDTEGDEVPQKSPAGQPVHKEHNQKHGHGRPSPPHTPVDEPPQAEEDEQEPTDPQYDDDQPLEPEHGASTIPRGRNSASCRHLCFYNRSIEVFLTLATAVCILYFV